MSIKDSNTNKPSQNLKTKRTYYKGKKSAKRVGKTPVFVNPTMQHTSNPTNITGRGLENSSDDYNHYQFK
jgi:hypothetical protein